MGERWRKRQPCMEIHSKSEKYESSLGVFELLLRVKGQISSVYPFVLEEVAL